MRKIFFSVVLVALAVLSLNGQKKKEYVNAPVSVNYCLPKVLYAVTVTLERTDFTPGPYWKYAEKELGVKPEIQAPGEEWALRDIDIKPQYVPDEKAVYAVSASGDYRPVMLSLTAEGFLTGVAAGEAGVFNVENLMNFNTREELADENVINIMNFNTYNHLKELLDTNYTYQEVDKVMKKVWDPIVRYAPKTEQDNVKEAVSEIFRIRSERVKLLDAENNVPDGKSLEIILKEFDRMEDNYLSLFMGKRETTTVRKTIVCLPGKADEAVVVFRFSQEDGITEKKDVSATPYILKIQNVLIPAAPSASAAADETQAAVCYRAPAVADLKLLKGTEELQSFRTIVPQLGGIRKFPVDVIAAEGLSLEFYPEYGSLKKVFKN